VATETHRPDDEDYWIAPWSRVLFSGDVFQAIPFGDQPTTILTDEEAESVKHYLGEVAFGFGLLISPTCDMYDQLAEEPRAAHPFRVLVPILPLEEVVAAIETVERSVGLLRSRDTLVPYMYLPALQGAFEESVACLFRPSVVADDFLADPPRRIVQMHPEARRQLKIKLSRYRARVDVARDQFPLHEKGEDEARADRYLAYTTGPWDLLVEAFVGSRNHMAEFLISSIGKLEGVPATETFNVLQIAKFGYEWEIPDLERHQLPRRASIAHPQ
jgi:hypothetical protein